MTRVIATLGLLLVATLPLGAGGAKKISGIRMLAFSPDGTLLAAAAGEPEQPGHLTVWNVATRAPVFDHAEPKGIPTVAFAPDGKLIAMGGFSEFAKLLDPATGKVLRELPGHGKAARGVAFTPDGQTLAVSSYDKFINFWEVQAGTLRKTLPNAHGDWIYCVAYTKDSKFLASSSADDSVKLWDATTHKLLHTFTFDSIVRHVSFSPDDRHVLIPSWDGSVQVVAVASGQVVRHFQGSGAEGVASTPDGKTLAVVRDNALQVFPLHLEEPGPDVLPRARAWIAQLNDPSIARREEAERALRQIGFAAEAELRKAKDSPFAEVRLRSRRLRTELYKAEPGQMQRRHHLDLEALAVSPKGDLLAVGGKEGVVRLYEVKTLAEVATLVPPNLPKKEAVPRVEY